jgi:hypothetical protein
MTLGMITRVVRAKVKTDSLPVTVLDVRLTQILE